MMNKDIPDLQEILNQVFSAAEEIRNAVANELNMKDGKNPYTNWMENKDYYPAYAYPPLNIFLTADRSMVFQIALGGFAEKDISLEFQGDHMVFSARAPENFDPGEDVRYFKRRLKLKSIAEQKYFVPSDKFNHEATTAIMKNSILTITIPSKESTEKTAGRPIVIIKEESNS